MVILTVDKAREVHIAGAIINGTEVINNIRGN